MFLEDMAGIKCGHPGCDHKSCDGLLWLHQACHTKKGLTLRCADNALVISCAVCQQGVVKIAIVREIKNYDLVWVTHLEGMLFVKEMETERTLETVDVASLKEPV